MTVKQILSLVEYGEYVKIFFDSDNVLEFDNGDFMLRVFDDYIVESISVGHSDSCYIQLNIKMLHEPVKASA